MKCLYYNSEIQNGSVHYWGFLIVALVGFPVSLQNQKLKKTPNLSPIISLESLIFPRDSIILIATQHFAQVMLDTQIIVVVPIWIF